MAMRPLIGTIFATVHSFRHVEIKPAFHEIGKSFSGFLELGFATRKPPAAEFMDASRKVNGHKKPAGTRQNLSITIHSYGKPAGWRRKRKAARRRLNESTILSGATRPYLPIHRL